jgi:hypothetical protein
VKFCFLIALCISLVYSSSSKDFLQKISHDNIKCILEAKYSVNILEKLSNNSIITKGEEENQKHHIFKLLNHNLKDFNHEDLHHISIDDILHILSKTPEEHTSEGFFA